MTSTSRLYQTKDLAKVTALSVKQSFMHSTFTLKMSESTADDAHECSGDQPAILTWDHCRLTY